MKKFIFMLLGATIMLCSMPSCVSENYSNGERIGLITQFSKTGIIYKSYEGELHVTQTGMNSTMTDFNFSIDNDHEDTAIINQIDSAAQHGWKVKLTYHETWGKNWFINRGKTDYFISKVEVLDKNVTGNLFNKGDTTKPSRIQHDTIYVVIYKNK